MCTLVWTHVSDYGGYLGRLLWYVEERAASGMLVILVLTAAKYQKKQAPM